MVAKIKFKLLGIDYGTNFCGISITDENLKKAFVMNIKLL
jgi:hypothetical protein